MRISLAQLNYTIGAFDENARKIKDSIARAKHEKADLVVFSELAVCGYPPLDLLEFRYFIDRCAQTIENIARSCEGIAAIIGSPVVNPNPIGKNIYNAACIINNTKIEQFFYKTLLPTYDIFDEYRYFERNRDFRLWEFKGHRIAVTVCEDLWYNLHLDDGFGKKSLYTVNPVNELMRLKPDFIINISASPYSYTQHQIREDIITENARNCRIPVLYVNQTGANTELIFDGASLIINSKGAIVDRMGLFREDFRTIDLNDLMSNKATQSLPHPSDVIENIHDALITGIRDYFEKMKFRKAVIGLSGGIDSAVTLVLACRALGNENVRVLLMPSQYSSEHSIKDAVDLARNLNVHYDIVPINDIFSQYRLSLKPLFEGLPEDIAEENIQARIRGNLLMAISNKFGHILLNTSNKSEAAVGYGTLYGDMSGGLSVLGDVYKTDVYRLAAFINRNSTVIPQNTITKPPSAELRPNQKDTDSLPAYEILDKILFSLIELKQSVEEIIAMGFEEALVKKVAAMIASSEYKRYQTPPILRISGKAFGMGRRMPLVAKY